ncbi:MAG: SDR family oxidoreductase [Actinobacteria bacterium]|nr:SDR family oxidoreductase [Actinomycetota bacterium]
MNVLVTGGAGFIGSHLVDALVERGDSVRVLDDLSNGRAENVNPAAQLFEGDVADHELAQHAVDGVEIVFHQAALGSVKRSIENPLATHHANLDGSLSMLQAARRAGVRRFVAASSSSVYGGAAPLPSREDFPSSPRSPYAVTKAAMEQYCRVYHELLGLETVCLRYFNVFGPRQRHDSEYAAVVPLFVTALRNRQRPTIFGDGQQRRDFTFVTDVVRANLLASTAATTDCGGHVYNVAGGQQHTVLDLLHQIADLVGVDADPVYADPRPGEIRDSAADLTAAGRDLGFVPEYSLEDGLAVLVRGS